MKSLTSLTSARWLSRWRPSAGAGRVWALRDFILARRTPDEVLREPAAAAAAAWLEEEEEEEEEEGVCCSELPTSLPLKWGVAAGREP